MGEDQGPCSVSLQLKHFEVTSTETMSDVLQKLNRLLDQTLASNAFYRSKLSGLKESLPLASLDSFGQEVPCTTKVEWIADQQAHPPDGTNLTFPMAS